jgi:hypothetical protein
LNQLREREEHANNLSNLIVTCTKLLHFANCAYLKLACAARKHHHSASIAGWSTDGVMTEGYGQRLGERLRIENAPAIVTRALRNADIAVTEVRCDNPPLEMTSAFQREDAFVITLHLRDRPNHEYWEDEGRAERLPQLAAEIVRADICSDRAFLVLIRNGPPQRLSWVVCEWKQRYSVREQV